MGPGREHPLPPGKGPHSICLPGFQNCRAPATAVRLIFFSHFQIETANCYPLSILHCMVHGAMAVDYTPFQFTVLWFKRMQITLVKSYTLESDTRIGGDFLGERSNYLWP